MIQAGAFSLVLIAGTSAATPELPPPPPPEFAIGIDPFPATARPEIDVPLAVLAECDLTKFFYCLRSQASGWVPARPVTTRVSISADEAGRIDRCRRFDDEQLSTQATMACQLARLLVPGARAFTADGQTRPYDVLFNWAAPERIASFANAEPAQPPRLIWNGYSTPSRRCNLLVCSEDYPMSAMRASAQGEVYYFAHVNAQGQATSCWPIIVTPHADLNQRSCYLIVHRARFEPATDAAGHAVDAIYAGRMVWKISD